MNRMSERWALGAVLGLAAIGTYSLTQSETVTGFARDAQTVAAVLMHDAPAPDQLASLVATSGVTVARELANSLVEPTNECALEDARRHQVARFERFSQGHRMFVIRFRSAVRTCKRS